MYSPPPAPQPRLVRQTTPLGTLLKSPPWTAPWRKPRLFLIWALVASIIAALLGEGWLALTKPPLPPPPPPPPAPPPQAVVLVIDTSGSMNNGSLDEVKTAAKAYVSRQDMTRTRIGVVEFGSSARTVSGLSRERTSLDSALDSLEPNGLTRMGLGLQEAANLLHDRPPLVTPSSASPESANVLLFTDGYPEYVAFGGPSIDPVQETNDAATSLKNAGDKLVAIGTTGSDADYLTQLTGSPGLVFETSQGSFDEAFARAEAVIKQTGTVQLISSGTQKNVGDGLALLRISGWNAILGVTLALALVLAQARITRARLGKTDALAVATGLGLGAIAGAIGQGVVALSTGEGNFVLSAALLVGWAVLGAGSGAALAWSLPNVRRAPILIGGTAGGVAGAIAFAIGARLGGDVVGRWAGCLAIGAGVGLMIALAEVAARRAWITVSFGPIDSYDLALGSLPIGVGSDRSCRAFVPAIEPVAARYGFENGTAFLALPDGRRETLGDGDTRTYGKASVILHLERGAPQGSPVQNAPVPFFSTTAPMSPPGAAPGYVPPTPAPSSVPVAPPPPPPAPVSVPAPPQGIKWKWDGGEAPLPPERERFSLGRASGNDIILVAPSVSGRHAQLERRAGRWILTDLGSTNGTFLDDVRLAPNVPTPLSVGQTVRLGALACRLERA